MRELMNLFEGMPAPREFMTSLYSYITQHWHRLPPNEQEKITNAFNAEMKEMDGSRTVYRGACVAGGMDELTYDMDFRNMDEITFNRFVSTTFDLSMAYQFTERCVHAAKIGVEVATVIFTIRTKPGAKGIRVQDYYPDDGHVKKEQELILNRGSRFKVVKRNRVEGAGGLNVVNPDKIIEHWLVDMEQIA